MNHAADRLPVPFTPRAVRAVRAAYLAVLRTPWPAAARASRVATLRASCAVAARALCLAATLAVSGAGVAGAADATGAYPERPVTLVVPYPSGGSNDLFARLIARELADDLGQPFVVDNRPGASGSTGTAQVARARKDGYQLVAVSSSMTTNAAIQPSMPFDPVRDLAPVAMLAMGPFIVAVNNDFPASNPAELIDRLKSQPGRYNYATSRVGSVNQFATELLKSQVPGLSVEHVAYRGMGPAVTDLIGGQTQLLVASGPSILPMVRAGKVKAVGITSATPSPVAPELTPIATAVPGYEFALWWGVLAPAGTPAPIVERLNAAVNRALQKPAVRDAILKEGAIAAPMPAAQFGKVVADDIERWKALAARQHIVAE